jgi:hypothetical protein
MQQVQSEWIGMSVGQFTPAALLQNQVHAATLSDSLIDELRLAEDHAATHLAELDNKCQQVHKH